MTTIAPSARISEIDILRGLVIILMALDHTRDYFILSAELANNPLDPSTPWAYLTRWITHICAPTFVFLAGVSAYLQLARGKTRSQLASLLLTRGLWLIALELTVISFGWSFGFPYLFFLQVIWAIGWAMLLLAGLIWLPRIAVLAIGVAIIAGLNLLDPINAPDFGEWSLLWTFLIERGPIFVGEQPLALVAYPILPWAGIMAFGYGLGALFSDATKQRDAKVFVLGIAMLALFAVLRWTMSYGETAAGDWTQETTLGRAFMVFMDVNKNPPSLQFTLATLGIVFTLWPLLSRLRGPVASVLNTFGAVPFFFYVLHVYLVHVLAIAANAAFGQPVAGQFNYLMNLFVAPEKFEGSGFALPWVYVAWVVVLALLYPVCRWWQQVKARERKWWMSYL